MRLWMALALVSAGLVIPTAEAASPTGQLSILRVVPNLAQGTLSIFGQNFGTPPQVWLAGTALTVTSATSTAIVATLPTGVIPGTYELLVRRPSGGAGAARRARTRWT